jgi:hypothetical protein
MLALGESVLLPALLMLYVLYPASIWTLAQSLKGKYNALMIFFAILSILIGGIGSIQLLADTRWYFQLEGIEHLLVGVLPSAFLVFAGVVSLLKMRRSRQADKFAAREQA